MIQIFLGQEERFKGTTMAGALNIYAYKYLYFYNVETSEISILNPRTGLLKRTDLGSIVELYYKDEYRERINKHLITWNE